MISDAVQETASEAEQTQFEKLGARESLRPAFDTNASITGINGTEQPRFPAAHDACGACGILLTRLHHKIVRTSLRPHRLHNTLNSTEARPYSAHLQNRRRTALENNVWLLLKYSLWTRSNSYVMLLNACEDWSCLTCSLLDVSQTSELSNLVADHWLSAEIRTAHTRF
jgi:hypothetical protein